MRCCSTVLTVIRNFSAISRLLCPIVARAATRRSASLRTSAHRATSAGSAPRRGRHHGRRQGAVRSHQAGTASDGRGPPDRPERAVGTREILQGQGSARAGPPPHRAARPRDAAVRVAPTAHGPPPAAVWSGPPRTGRRAHSERAGPRSAPGPGHVGRSAGGPPPRRRARAGTRACPGAIGSYAHHTAGSHAAPGRRCRWPDWVPAPACRYCRPYPHVDSDRKYCNRCTAAC